MLKWLAFLCFVTFSSHCLSQRVLFDGRHGETAGNADWIVDADSKQLFWQNYECRGGRNHSSAQRFPTPDQAGITLATKENYWTGGISAWGVELVQDNLRRPERNWQIEQYPWDAGEFTFGDSSKPQDLSNYDVLILCEPNLMFTPAEAQAIREFVWNGGGLFMIADHETSDRNCSGGRDEKHDSPFILNRMMQTAVETSTTPPYYLPDDPENHYGVFGIWYYENGNDGSDRQNKDFDWYSEDPNNNVSDDPDDPLLNGPFGSGRAGIGLHGATQMAVCTHPERGNPGAMAHIWRNGQSHERNGRGVWQRVTLASSRYGQGRVVALSDSSPTEERTGDPQDQLYDGWFQLASRNIHLNGTEWLANPVPDEQPPVYKNAAVAEGSACGGLVTWSTDEPARYQIRFGSDRDSLTGSRESGSLQIGHQVALGGLPAEARYFFQVRVWDGAGNGPTLSDIGEFTTDSAAELAFTTPVSLSDLRSDRAMVNWQTNLPATATVLLQNDQGVVTQREAEPAASEHHLSLDGLTAGSAYTLVVEARDACGSTVLHPDVRFETDAALADFDLSGWKVTNDRSPNMRIVIPAGTVVPMGGALIIGRENDRSAFEDAWGALPLNSVYLNSGNQMVINGNARRFTLARPDGSIADGPSDTVANNQAKMRRDGCSAAGAAASWQLVTAAQATPGSALPQGCGATVVISEMADAPDYKNEFIEIFVH